MEFYLSIDGDKKGPFTLLKVGSLLEDATVTPDTLAWHKGQEGWLPIREVPALESMVEAVTREKEVAEAAEADANEIPDLPKQPTLAPGGQTQAVAPSFIRQVRPFTRFWARMFDCMLVMTLVYFFVDTSFLMPRGDESMADWLVRYQEQIASEEAMAIASTIVRAFVGWHFLEAAMLYLWGTTPGKAILGIRVRTLEGERPSPLRALGRSLPIMLLGLTFSFFRLMATGQCLWDQHLKLESSAERLSPVRIVLVIFAFFALVMLQSLKFS